MMTEGRSVESAEHLAAQGEVFFLEPEAERFVRGETERLPIDGCMLLVLIPFVLGGLLILSLSVLEWVRISELNSIIWFETQGTYVSKEIGSKAVGPTRYHVTYRFVVDDRVYVVTESVEQLTYVRAGNGESLPVSYALHDPNIASIEPVSRDRRDNTLGLICGNLFWWGVVLGLAYYLLSKVHKRQRLSREGILIGGEIVYCSGYEDSDNDFRLKAEVRFRSPQTGEWIHKEYSPTRNDLKGMPLPGPGTRVHVLYLDDKTYGAL
jgi:hypothetical protein